MSLRPYWSGQIRLSLVSLPVNIYAALNRSRQISLHEIYRPTGERVHHTKMAEGEAVERDDIVKGYEYAKGEYVILEPDEIKDLKVPSSETIDLVQFVPAAAIDEIYFETPYFVAPDGHSAEEAFVIIREALRETAKVGIGQLAIAGRERLCSLKPYGSGLILETLRYEEEIRKSDPYFEDIKEIKIHKEQLDLAKEIIKRKSGKFAPEQFHDHYREALQALIDAKLKHEKPKASSEEPKSSGKVINLMDALRKSLSQDGPKETKAKRQAGAKPVAKSKRSVTKKPGKPAHPRKKARA